MRYEDFVESVARRAGIEGDRAQKVSRAVLQALAEQVDSDVAGSLLSQLPRELRSPTRTTEAPRPLTLDEFRERVGDLAGVDAFDLDRHVRAVVVTLRDAVTGGQVEELVARLPAGYRDFLPEEAEPVAADAFFARVQQHAELPSQRDAEIATRAALAALGDRISKGQAYDLATPLPVELRPLLKAGSPGAEGFEAASFLDRLAGRQQVDIETAGRHAGAVLRTIREHTPEKEIRDTLDQLPAELAAMFR